MLTSSQSELPIYKELLINYQDKHNNLIPSSNNNNKTSNNTPFLTSKSSPARIKDLIHATIEKNLQSKNNGDSVKSVKSNKADRSDSNGMSRSIHQHQQQQWKTDASNYTQQLQQQFMQQQLLQHHKILQQQQQQQLAQQHSNKNMLFSKSSTVDDSIKQNLQQSPTHQATHQATYHHPLQTTQPNHPYSPLTSTNNYLYRVSFLFLCHMTALCASWHTGYCTFNQSFGALSSLLNETKLEQKNEFSFKKIINNLKLFHFKLCHTKCIKQIIMIIIQPTLI